MKNVLNMIKAINERMAVYERKGLTESAYYNDMKKAIQLLNLPTTQSKTGNIRISRSKTDLQNINTSNLKVVYEKPSLRQEMNKLKKQGFKKTSAIYEQIKSYGTLKEFAENNLEFLYQDSRMGLDIADEIVNDFTSGNIRHMTYNQIKEKIRIYENERNKSYQELYKSRYFGFD